MLVAQLWGARLRELSPTVGSLQSPRPVKDASPGSDLNGGGCVTSRPVRRPAPLGPAEEGAAHNALRGTAGALGAKRGAAPTMHRVRRERAAGTRGVRAVCPLCPRLSPVCPSRVPAVKGRVQCSAPVCRALCPLPGGQAPKWPPRGHREARRAPSAHTAFKARFKSLAFGVFPLPNP